MNFRHSTLIESVAIVGLYIVASAKMPGPRNVLQIHLGTISGWPSYAEITGRRADIVLWLSGLGTRDKVEEFTL